MSGMVKCVGGADVFREELGHYTLVVPVEPATLFAPSEQAESGELSFCHPVSSSEPLDVSAKVMRALLGDVLGQVT